VNRILYLAAIVLLISACSEKQPEATPPEVKLPEVKLPEVKLPEAKPLKEKLSKVMQRETLGVNIAYLEGITGPAMYISDDGTERTYKVEDCDFQVKTLKKQNHESVAAIRFQITPECDVDIGEFIAVMADDKFPALSELTFGNAFKESLFGIRFYSDCLIDCVNAPVYGYWIAPPVLNELIVVLEADQFSNEIIDATRKWRDYMIKDIGEEWVRQAKFNCDPYKYSSEASKFFSSVHPTAITIGYDLGFDDSSYCKEKALVDSSTSVTKKAEPISGKANETDLDTISGVYSGTNRYAQFEKLKNGDVRFYISGMEIGSMYPCTIGELDSEYVDEPTTKISILKMNGVTGGYSDNENVFSVEFGDNTARIIVLRSKCIFDGTYQKEGGKGKISWSGYSG